jgi:hypothetical protein
MAGAYKPGQKEPKEYIDHIVEFVALLNKGQLDCVVLLVGFDNKRKVKAVVGQTEELGLKCTSAKAGPRFRKRNPIIEYRYPPRVRRSALLEDARQLRGQGATDLSAVNIDQATGAALREIFGVKSCPFLVMVR